ncbi:MAG: transcription-repair coupling factor [Verrucomicrobiota bacterium]
MSRLQDSVFYHGVCLEARPALAAKLALEGKGQTYVLIIASPREAEARAIEIGIFAEWRQNDPSLKILYFPESPPPDIDPARRADRTSDRIAVLSHLLQPLEDNRLIVATPEAIFGAAPERKHFETRRIELSVGKEYSYSALVNTLTNELNYDAEALCEHPGEIATRGGLIDIYPFDADCPYRIDFFGDEIESIRSFDPTTQRTVSTVQSIPISAAISESKDPGTEGNFLDYLPEKPIHWIFEEPSLLVREHPLRFEQRSSGAGGRTNFKIAFGERDEVDRLIGISELDTDPRLFKGTPRRLCPTEAVKNYRIQIQDSQIGLDRFESEQSARSKFESQIADWSKIDRFRIIFATAGPTEASRIKELLLENPLTAKIKPVFLEGSLSGGFITTSESAGIAPEVDNATNGSVLITDTEFFGQRSRKPGPRRERARPNISHVDQLLDFTELADGDPLVHLQHGVCLFRGLTQLEIEGGQKEVISVEFANEMTIHVPLHESHLLTRYVGLTKVAPKLGKVGGAAWEKTRQAAEVAALDYAAELLNLHAKRAQSGGYAFPPDHEWQKNFEEAFPFRETPDQLRAIIATKEDMEQPVPMDRLICGDVGFGKTEVAIRAALKAVLAGKQVAVLVPTTVLCQQHFNTFRERMAQYPIVIDMVSRFRSASQNKQILSNVAEGKVDIVIGTHRLLSKDVHIPNLGLLVVDEEQRFGVRQKERIKQLRADIDILTLSATPIPRTLYLAMAGARAMSVIETPPVDRRPIETIVKSYDQDLIRSAIQSETDRGGQVFYLHNRIDTIEGVASDIREMHPKLKVAVGHGQMEEGQLEKIMTRFVAGSFDVLVCTTIIESGIDIPNCNTLIIEGADRFGLAQLYQIRGRVGRFKRQAYAYLLLHRHAALVEQAQKRLNALKQHNQLGAGFRIAMRDLELRGAGNLLGSQQSGHIAGVGFELYCQLLKESVARLKGEPGSDRLRAEVKLDFIAAGEGSGSNRRTSGTFSFAAIKDAEYGNRKSKLIEASLPAEYVAEPRLRIDLYRRLALADSLEKVQEISDEIKDRFGKMPKPTQALIATSEIRVLAEAAGVQRVESEGDRLICRYARPEKNSEFLKGGSRFPRLTAKDPLVRLKEIKKFLARNRK